MTDVDAITFALFAIEYQKRGTLDATIQTAAEREIAGVPYDEAKSTLAELRRRLREEERHVPSPV